MGITDFLLGGTTTKTKNIHPDSYDPYISDPRISSTQLREGVSPQYSPAAETLTFEQWKAANPSALRSAPTNFGVEGGFGDTQGAPLSDAEVQANYDQYLANPEFQPRLINPASDFAETVDQYGGIMPEAQTQFGRAMDTGYIGPSEAQFDTSGRQIDYGRELAGGAADLSRAAGGDAYRLLTEPGGPDFENVGDIAGVGGSLSDQFSAIARSAGGGAQGYGSEAGTSDLAAAYRGLGATDPTAALSKILGGEIDTEGLAGMQEAYVNRALQDYRDSVSDAGDMWQQQIAPQLRGDAILAGQYGGSRQGVAEGVASGMIGKELERSARDIGIASIDTGQQLYGQAYQDMLARQAGAAGQQSGLAGQASIADTEAATRAAMAEAENRTRASIATAGNAAQLAGYQANLLGQDASNELAAQQFNANLGMARNQEEMQLYQQQINDMVTGANLGAGAINMGGAAIDAEQAVYDAQGRPIQDAIGERDFGWDQLAQYNAILGSQQGNVTSTTQPQMGAIEALGYMTNIGAGIGGLGAGTQVASNVPTASMMPSTQPAPTDAWGQWAGV